MSDQEEYEIKEIKEILKKYLFSFNKELDLYKYHKKKNKLSWKSIAGKLLADGSYIKSLEDGLLIIGCKHSTYIQILQIEKKNILIKLQKEYPSLRITSIKSIVDEEWFIKKEEKNKISSRFPIDDEFKVILKRIKEIDLSE